MPAIGANQRTDDFLIDLCFAYLLLICLFMKHVQSPCFPIIIIIYQLFISNNRLA